VKNVEKPILFLHGDHDNYVLADNLDIWKAATQNSERAIYKLYPGVNHYFTNAQGKLVEGVAEDIANFIRDQN